MPETSLIRRIPREVVIASITAVILAIAVSAWNYLTEPPPLICQIHTTLNPHVFECYGPRFKMFEWTPENDHPTIIACCKYGER